MTWNPFKKQDEAQVPVEESAKAARPEPTTGKGHATPKRKDAQEQNLRPLVPKDRKASAKAAKARQREKENAEYEAMRTGDINHMPKAERLPWRVYIRDYVDARFNIGEFFIPVAFGILIVSMVVSFFWPVLSLPLMLLLYVYLFALIFGLIGFVDDYRKVRQHQNEGLTARQKFILQLLAAVVFLVLMRYEGLLTNDLYIPFLNVSVTINWIVYLIFAAFVIVGCVNAVNLTDGIDGLASGVTFVVMVFFAVVGALWGSHGVQALFPAAMAGGLAAFFVYNHHPAKVFMGDTGSLFLGGAVAALAFVFDMPLVLIPVGIIYILETLSDIIQVGYFKLTHGKRFFKMAPLHHHLELSGWSEAKLVAVFSLVTLIGCALAYLGIQGRY